MNGKRNQDEQLRFPVVAQVQPGEGVCCSVKLIGDAFLFTVVSAYATLGAPADPIRAGWCGTPARS